MAERWYVLRSKPRKEDLLWDQLRVRKIEAFHPQIRVRPVNPRARKVKSYFPGYVFVRVDLNRYNWSTLQWLPGATGVVSFGGEPADVPDTLIQAIRRRVDEINAAGGEQLDGLKQGDRVIIRGGPFDGYEAIFDAKLSGNERVRVLLKFLEVQPKKLDLPAEQIEQKKRR